MARRAALRAVDGADRAGLGLRQHLGFDSTDQSTLHGLGLLANDANGNQNRLLVYDIEGTITFEKAFDVDINLWGIHATANRLYAIQDNSSNVAVFENFFAQEEGALEADHIIAVEGLACFRVHTLSLIKKGFPLNKGYSS